MAVAARALLAALSCKLGLAWPGQRPWNGTGFARKEGIDISGDGSALGGRVLDLEGEGLVIRAKDLCIKDLRTVHAAEFIFRSVVPEAMSGLMLLMLRPLGPERRTWSIVRASDLQIVEHSSTVRVSRIADGSLSINDMCASTHTTLSEFSKTLQVPADTRINFYFQPRHEGLEGDCLAWYVPAGGAGGILASSHRAEASQSFEVLAWADGKVAPLEGAQLVSKSASSVPYLVSWRLTVSFWDLQQWPRQHRLWALTRKVMPSVCLPGLTTEAFKRGILTLFRAPEWADSAVVEIGALRGSTTVFLSMVFSLVFAVEIYCGAFTGGFPNVRNVVKLCLDSSKDYAFSMLAENSNIRAAVIDGDHRYMRVVGDIFRVLHDIPCCVSVIAFHDYCDDEVFQAIKVFVDGGVLRYQDPLGENPGSFFWCKEGRPEGAIFAVLRYPSTLAFQQRLESVHQRVMGWHRLADLEADLEGSEWVLTSDRGEMGHIVLRVQPRPCELFWLPPHGQTVPEELKLFRLIGWSQQDEYNSRWSAQVLAGELFDGESGQPLASISFDFALTGFTLVMSPLGIERYGRTRGQGFVGIRRSHIAELSTAVDWRNR